MLTAYEKLDTVLRYLKDIHDEPIVVNKVMNEEGLEGSSISSAEFQKHWKNDLEIRVYALLKKVDIRDTRLILTYLLDEKLVYFRPYNGDNQYSITFTGKMLIENGGFEERERRLKIDYGLKEQQLKKTNWEVKLMIPTFFIAVVSIVLSFLSLFVKMPK